MLIAHPSKTYRFLTGIDPYSCGVVAEPGFEILRSRLATWLPWREGFEKIDAHLKQLGLPRSALCAMELRSPQPFTMQGFIEYNRGYCAVLRSWGLLVDGLNPIARTNVAPRFDPPAEVSLHAFSWVQPNAEVDRRTFVVAGAGELREGTLESERIVRRGDVSPAGMFEKCEYVLSVMEERLHGLGTDWREVTQCQVYTVHDLDARTREHLVQRTRPAARAGLTWHATRPPVVDIEFEMDVMGLM